MRLAGDFPLFAIVGGSTKSGTTSLYHYLKAHPEVCVSNIKETRFFLDEGYPLSAKYRYQRDGIEKYLSYFHDPTRAKKVWIEVTPDYLYSPGTPLVIKRTLPESKIIFLLGEPVSRVISWYRFALQNGMIGSEITPAEYIQRQLNGKIPLLQCWFAVEQGRYAYYLKNWFEFYKPEEIKIVFFEVFASDPGGQMFSLAEFLGIDLKYYRTYDFRLYNKTVSVRSPRLHRSYKKVQSMIRLIVFPYPKIHSFLREFRSTIDPLYAHLNRHSEGPKFQLDQGLLQSLVEYYQPSNEALEALINRSLPPSWKHVQEDTEFT